MYDKRSDADDAADRIADELIARLEDSADEEVIGVEEIPRSLADAAASLERMKATKEGLAAQMKDLEQAIKRLEQQHIPDLMSKAGLVHNGRGNFTTASGGKIALRNEVHVGVAKDDAPKLHSWLRERGDGSLIQEVVNAQTLKAHCKALIAEGVTLPPFITQYVETKAVLTRGRKETQ